MFGSEVYQLSVPPRDAESNRLRFYRNKFARSSDSLENHESGNRWRPTVVGQRDVAPCKDGQKCRSFMISCRQIGVSHVTRSYTPFR
jgi:hypothetical protein